MAQGPNYNLVLAGVYGVPSTDANGNLLLTMPNGVTWTSGGSLKQSADGIYALTDAVGDQNVSLQIGNGTASSGTGTLGITFGTRGSASAINLSKQGAGATLAIQSGAGAWAGTIGSSYGLNGSGGGALGMSFSGTMLMLNAASGTSLTKPTATKTANYTVTANDSNTLFNNTGAGGTVTFTLPTAAAGLTYTFVNTGAGAGFTKIGAGASDKIAQAGTLGGAAGSLASTAVWSTVKVECMAAGTWVVTATTGGAWTLT